LFEDPVLFGAAFLLDEAEEFVLLLLLGSCSTSSGSEQCRPTRLQRNANEGTEEEDDDDDDDEDDAEEEVATEEASEMSIQLLPSPVDNNRL